MNRFEWWFLPVLNVDGYVYTWDVDRTWRKSRGPTKNVLCFGADPNRNWNVNWAQYGASSNPCSSSYHGDEVFSEQETRQLAKFLLSVNNLFGYISFHSFGELLMLPYASSTDYSPEHDLLMEGVAQLPYRISGDFRAENSPENRVKFARKLGEFFFRPEIARFSSARNSPDFFIRPIFWRFFHPKIGRIFSRPEFTRIFFHPIFG